MLANNVILILNAWDYLSVAQSTENTETMKQTAFDPFLREIQFITSSVCDTALSLDEPSDSSC